MKGDFPRSIRKGMYLSSVIIVNQNGDSMTRRDAYIHRKTAIEMMSTIARSNMITAEAITFRVGVGIFDEDAPIELAPMGLSQSKCRRIFTKCMQRIDVNRMMLIWCMETF